MKWNLTYARKLKYEMFCENSKNYEKGPLYTDRKIRVFRKIPSPGTLDFFKQLEGS